MMPFSTSFFGIDMLPTSGMPGYPFGPEFLNTSTLSSRPLRAQDRLCVPGSPRHSNTTAGPRCIMSADRSRRRFDHRALFAEIAFQTTVMPDSGFTGSATVKITSRL